jgi:hypothetical protein
LIFKIDFSIKFNHFSEAPSTPTKPTVTENSPKSVTLEWEAGPDDKDTPIEGFNVSVREKGSTRWRKVTKEVSKKTSYSVTDLNPGSEYEAQITAVNPAGESKPSVPSAVFKVGEPVEAKVEEPVKAKVEEPAEKNQKTEIPKTEPMEETEESEEVSPEGPEREETGAKNETPTAPGKPKVKHATPAQVALEWSEPENGGQVPVEGYTVFVREEGTKPWEKVTEDLISEPSFVLPELKKGKQYQARVTATNANGESQPSEPSDHFTQEPAKPEQSAGEKTKPDPGMEKPKFQRQPSETEISEPEKKSAVQQSEAEDKDLPAGKILFLKIYLKKTKQFFS